MQCSAHTSESQQGSRWLFWQLSPAVSEKGIILKSGMAQHVDKSLTNAAYVRANTCVCYVCEWLCVFKWTFCSNARFSLQALLWESVPIWWSMPLKNYFYSSQCTIVLTTSLHQSPVAVTAGLSMASFPSDIGSFSINEREFDKLFLQALYDLLWADILNLN